MWRVALQNQWLNGNFRAISHLVRCYSLRAQLERSMSERQALFHQPRISGRQRLYDLARREARRSWL